MPRPGTLLHRLRYAPRGRLLHWLIRRRGLELLCHFAVLYLTVGVVFAVIYFALPFPFKGAATPSASSVAFATDCLHFSFVTQATVGYGDILPVGWARLVAAFQALLGLALIAIGIGIVLLKLTNRPPAWLFADNLTYDPRSHQMVAWVWNRDARTFYGAAAKIIVGRALLVGASARIGRHKIATQAGPPSVLSSGRTFLIRATTAFAASPETQAVSEQLTSLSPAVLRPDDYVQFIVSAAADDSGATFWAHRTYHLSDVRCGRRSDVLPIGAAEPPWVACDYDNFNRVLPTPAHECRPCPLHYRCPLEVAFTTRATILRESTGENAEASGPLTGNHEA